MTITVADFNDNPPVFTGEPYAATLTEVGQFSMSLYIDIATAC